MKALIIGTGGVGESIAAISPPGATPVGNSSSAWSLPIAISPARSGSRTDSVEDRFPAEQVDGMNPDAVAALATKPRRRHRLQPASHLRGPPGDEGWR